MTTTKIIGKTSTENDIMIWAEVDGVEYGINEKFDGDTLCCAGTACSNIDSESMAHYEEVTQAIKEAADDVDNIPFV